MTLQEWKEKTGIIAESTEFSGDCKIVIKTHTTEKHPLWTELWHLDDFAVSTVAGLVIWLLPKQFQEENRK